MRAFLFSLFVAVSATAAPVITSVTPNTGAVAGSSITINGSGFNQPEVLIGSVRATIITIAGSTAIMANTPPLLPGTYDVTVNQSDGSTTAKAAFTVPGDSGPFEPILLPVFSPPMHGAFGSLFVTDARAFATTEQPVNVYGMLAQCFHTTPSPDPLITQIPGGSEVLFPACSPSTARLVYVAQNQAQNITFNDRVTDNTRIASNLGTEIPIVRGSRMTNNKITLLNVPIDGRYRNTLRIYALRPTVVFVTTVGTPMPIQLQPGASIFEPAYAPFTDFPVPVDPGSTGTMTVTIEQPQDIVAGPPMWAFITVTNNETQQITTITPD